MLFPDSVVLGNFKFSGLEASIYAGFWMTFLIWVFWDFARAKGMKFDEGIVRFFYFWLVNSFALWIIARFPYIAGFGIDSYLWAFVIGFLTISLHNFVWVFVTKK